MVRAAVFDGQSPVPEAQREKEAVRTTSQCMRIAAAHAALYCEHRPGPIKQCSGLSTEAPGNIVEQMEQPPAQHPSQARSPRGVRCDSLQRRRFKTGLVLRDTAHTASSWQLNTTRLADRLSDATLSLPFHQCVVAKALQDKINSVCADALWRFLVTIWAWG